MNEDVASRWYVPFELELLRRSALLVIMASLPMLWVVYLRGEGWESVFLASAGSLLAIRALAGRNRDLMMITFSFILLSGLLTMFTSSQRGVAFVDVWYAVILILSGGCGLWLLGDAHLSVWLKGGLGASDTESGLARNKRLSPLWLAITTHAVLLHAVAVVIVPVIWILDVSLSPGQSASSGLGIADWTLENFSSVLGNSDFWTWTMNSIIVSLGTTLLGLTLAVPAGYAFSRYRFSGHGAMMFSLLLVQMFPGIIILVPYFMVMKTLGLLNTWLGLILAYSVTALPFCVWMLKGWFDTVPRELEEAAALDGCGPIQTFRRVILPLSLPAIAVTALFSFLAAWNEFLLALVFNTSSDMYTLPVGLASYISESGARWGDFAAMSLLVSLPVVILFIIFQRSLIEGLSAGSVKG